MQETIEGWRFYSADFSIQATEAHDGTGTVTLIRAPDERERWHRMTEEEQELCPLFVRGEGRTITEALTDAYTKARRWA
ncbi:MAG: hypothetical protein WC455_18780 [Dehalococcoidia bacterium]|jgi:hypothetical protein